MRILLAILFVLLVGVAGVGADTSGYVAGCLDLQTTVDRIAVRYWQYSEWHPPVTYDAWVEDPAQIQAMLYTDYTLLRPYIVGVRDQRWILYDGTTELGRVVVWTFDSQNDESIYILNVKDSPCILWSLGEPAGYP